MCSCALHTLESAKKKDLSVPSVSKRHVETHH